MTQLQTTWENQAPRFYELTREAFRFLEEQYGYHIQSTRTENMQYWQDALAEVLYVGERMAVSVTWMFADPYIGVTFIELKEPGVVPHSVNVYGTDATKPRAIHLNTLAEFRGHAKDPDFLLHGRGLSGKRPQKARRDLIENNMTGVLDGLARATQHYAADVLAGDTSSFAEVVRFYAKKMGVK